MTDSERLLENISKDHWSSIKADGDVPDDLMAELLDKSYEVILGGFSRKKQDEILGRIRTKRLVILRPSDSFIHLDLYRREPSRFRFTRMPTVTIYILRAGYTNRGA